MKETYGGAHAFSADSFNEMEPESWSPAYLSDVSQAIYQGIAGADSEALWSVMVRLQSYVS